MSMRGRVSAVVAAVLAGSLLVVPEAAAAVGGTAADPIGAPRSVPVTPVSSKAGEPAPMPLFDPGPVVWPTAGAAVVELPLSADGLRRTPGRGSVGGLPVSVGPADGVARGDLAATPARVSVEVLDRADTQRAGFPLAVRLGRADGGTGAARARLEVDYSAFRHAYGADWDSRLGLVTVPPCALVAPMAESCAGTSVLPTLNDNAAGVLTADVDVPATGGGAVGALSDGGGGVVALLADGNGNAGDFGRSDLSPSASWAAGGSSANFAWSYPIAVPPVPSGLSPEVTFAYSSGSVDGQTAASNTQTSWLGEGWSYHPGFIERSYRQCKDDLVPTAPQWSAANTYADPCWRTDNARIVWNGRSTELVPLGGGVWKMQDDDVEKVELLSDTGSTITGHWHNERWKITTTDGSQYFFGKSQIPGLAAATASVLGVNVISNHTGEPCFDAGSLYASTCRMAWRWQLDYVVDRHGNSMVLSYARETNNQRVVGTPSAMRYYERAAHLSRIDYGWRAGQEGAAPAPARVVFGTGDRCLTTTCATHNKANWPDTPWDLDCPAVPCGAPSFWSTKRLDAVTADVWSGSGPTYLTVNRWDLTQNYPSTLNTTSPAMWLAGIGRTGKAERRPHRVANYGLYRNQIRPARIRGPGRPGDAAQVPHAAGGDRDRRHD
jgi:hypothetical protein